MSVETEELARLALGGRKIRRRRLSRALLARLLGHRFEEEDKEGEEAVGEEEGGDREHKIARLLIGSGVLRRRHLRNLLLAHLLRERGETKEEDEEGDEEQSEGGEESAAARADRHSHPAPETGAAHVARPSAARERRG
jgi:hypothetical protein